MNALTLSLVEGYMHWIRGWMWWKVQCKLSKVFNNTIHPNGTVVIWRFSLQWSWKETENLWIHSQTLVRRMLGDLSEKIVLIMSSTFICIL